MRHFKESEFARCTPSCGMADMDSAFLDLMDRIRDEAGMPLVINSAYRSPAWETSKGRPEDGPHTTGKAVDFSAGDSRTRYRIVQAAVKLGVTRIGISSSFVHIDISDKHDQQVIWLY